jgi:hypothetical protein
MGVFEGFIGENGCFYGKNGCFYSKNGCFYCENGVFMGKMGVLRGFISEKGIKKQSKSPLPPSHCHPRMEQIRQPRKLSGRGRLGRVRSQQLWVK